MLALLGASPVFAQWTNWRFWKSSDGFPESYTRSLAVGADGSVVVRHGSVGAMSVLDGYGVRQVPEIQGGPIEDWGMRSRAYTSVNGDIWTVDRGQLRRYRSGTWRVEAPRDGAHPMLAAVPRAEDRVLILFADSLALYTPSLHTWNVLKSAGDTCLGQFRQIVPGFSADFWITGDAGIAHLEFSPDGTPGWTQSDIHALGLEKARNPIPARGHAVYVSAQQGSGHWELVRWSAEGLQRLYAGTQDNLRGWQGPDDELWVLDGASLLHMVGDRLQPAHKPGAVSGVVSDVFALPDGSFWLGTSDGAAQFAPAIWRTPTPVADLDLPVSSMAEDAKGRLWAAANEYLLELDGDTWSRHLLPLGMRCYTVPTRSLMIMGDGRIGLRARGDDGAERVLRFDPASGRFDTLVHPQGRAVNPLASAGDGRFWVLTNPGHHIELYDGNRFLPQFDIPASWTGDIRSVAAGADGVVWLGGSGGLLRAKDGVVRALTAADGFTDTLAADLLSLGPNRILAGGREKLMSFDGRKWSEMRSAIDRVRMITQTHDGSLWVSTGSGLQRLLNGNWVGNEEEEGLPSTSVYAIFQDSRGRLWAGTTRGLSLYHPKADREAPSVGFSTADNMREAAPDGHIRVIFRAADKWKNTPADRLLFSYRLDAAAWSPFGEGTSATFDKLPFGAHRIWVRAMDRNANVYENPTPFTFRVILPWYRQPGFHAILFIAGLAIVGLLALAASNYGERGRFIVALNNARVAAETASRHKSAFLANMSHEIRTPMHAITGMTGLALEEATDDKQRGYLTHAQKASQSLLALVNDIVDFSKVEAGNVEIMAANFNLLECLRTALGPLELQAKEKGLRMDFDIDAGIPSYVVGDDRRLGQVITNLVGNAIKFSSRGEIRMDVRLAAKSEEHVDLEIVVSDSGIGIAGDKQRSIFGAFEQADGSMTRKYGGTGLGLAMCAKLVHLMEGRIWVESPWRSAETRQMVAGSAFHFTVRMRPGKAPEAATVAPKVAPKISAVAPRNLRILLAEDNPVNQKLVVHLLRRRGHTVAIANNGREAVEIARRESVDLVLMDVQMPEMDGFQATAAIRAWEQGRGSALCIVALTAHAMDGDKERCLAHGFDLYLAKPFRPDELDGVLAEGAARSAKAMAS